MFTIIYKDWLMYHQQLYGGSGGSGWTISQSSCSDALFSGLSGATTAVLGFQWFVHFEVEHLGIIRS